MATNTVKLRPGEVTVINGKAYVVCDVCSKVVRINKPILGSLHLCD